MSHDVISMYVNVTGQSFSKKNCLVAPGTWAKLLQSGAHSAPLFALQSGSCRLLLMLGMFNGFGHLGDDVVFHMTWISMTRQLDMT